MELQVMILDDEYIILDGLCSFPWEMYGFTIASVCDSEQQAISYFGEYSYALVICDLQLRQGGTASL